MLDEDFKRFGKNDLGFEGGYKCNLNFRKEYLLYWVGKLVKCGRKLYCINLYGIKC